MADEPNLVPVATDTGAAADETGSVAPAADEATILGGDATAQKSDATPAVADGATGDGDLPVAVDDAGKNAQNTPPETYADFTLPEGVELDATTLETASPLFKELGLTQEQAQKLVDFQASQIQAGAQRQLEDFNQLTNGWREQSVNDKEFGGDKFDESTAIARQAVEKFGTPELKTLMEEHGIGNHPEMIRMLVKVGKLTQEDLPGKGDAVSPAADRVSILYPDSKTA